MRLWKLIIFDGLTSINHVAIGALTRFLASYVPPLSLLIIVMYSAYQVLERELPINKLGDFIEFIIGYLIGDVLWGWLGPYVLN